MAITKIEEDITALWARLNPVAGYTSGRAADIKSLFLPTEKEVQDANTAIGSLKKRTGEITDPGLKTTADKQLDLLATQLAYPQPGMGVQDCGDGAFYITLLHGRPFSRPSPEPWLQGFLGSAAQKIALETERLMPLSLQGTPRQQCLSAAAYCRETMAILKKQFPTADITEVDSHLTAFEKVVSAPGLGSDDFGVMFQALRETTTSPVYTEGYPQLLTDLYDFAPSASDLDLTATAWLERDMPVVEELAAELAVLLKIPHDSTVGEVWEAAGTKWAVPADRFTETYERVAKACNEYARNHLVEVPADDTLLLDATPAYMTSVITGGQDIAVDYLTNSPRACLYITQGKATSLLTLINILVHEYSHGINFVLSAERAASPLLNLAGPMQVPLTEGQAFWREWEYWHAAADLFGRKDLDASQQAYLKLYGATPAAQAQAIRAAQFETYIWRVVRHLRAMCDVQVNMGWRTVVDFLDWAAKRTGLSKEFLFGECFTFLAQPGYAPAYGIDGMRYGELQRKSAKTQHDFNTTASGMGFYPWTQCVTRLSA